MRGPDGAPGSVRGAALSSDTLVFAVTFNPSLGRLSQVITAVVPQARMVILDNGSDHQAAVREQATASGAEVILSPANVGLAEGYNVAISWAQRSRTPFLMLLDQDTIVPPGYVESLVEIMLLPRADDLVAVGGRPVDRRAERFGRGEKRRDVLHQSSATLFRVSAFDTVGPFDAALFIHHVDKEWYLRAQALGFRLETVGKLDFDHEIGTAVSRCRFLPKGIHWQSDIRLFYGVRNTLWLLGRPYLPLRWRCGQVLKISAIVALHFGFRSGRMERARAVKRAISAGRRPRTMLNAALRPPDVAFHVSAPSTPGKSSDQATGRK